MTRRKKILFITGSSIVGLLLLLVIAALIVVQTAWFANFARQKIIASIEQAMGGVVEIGAFQVDFGHLTIRIRDFVLHGREPASADPLARIGLLQVRLKLFSGFRKVIDLQYLGVEEPRVNLIFLPDGTTNIPQPKVPSKPSEKSGLQTVVDLAVNKFELKNGLVKVLDQAVALNARGENLRVLLNYDSLHPSYNGNVSVDPLIVASRARPPLNIHLNLPVTLEPDAVRISNAILNTAQSEFALSGSIEDMKTPAIVARLKGHIFLPEMQRSFDLPMDATMNGAPKELTVDLAGRFDQRSKAIAIERAHVALGTTTLDASGALQPGSTSAVQFRAGFALEELSRLFKLRSIQMTGGLEANGRVNMDPHNNFQMNGALSSRDLAVRSGTTRVTDITLSSPFHADPFLISVDGLRLTALGGSIRAKLFLKQLQKLSVEANLRDFSVPVLVATITGKPLGYDGFLNGDIRAGGDLRAERSTGYKAKVSLTIEPGRRNIPLSGNLNANYDGARDVLDIGQSYLTLPNSQLNVKGSLNRRIDLQLTSRNLADFLPAINLGLSEPQTSLPVVLQGGTAVFDAQVTGKISSPRIDAHLNMDDFAVRKHPFQKLSLSATASPSGAMIQNGMLTGRGVSAKFDASMGLTKWKPVAYSPLSANLSLPHSDLGDVMSLAGGSSLAASGDLTVEFHASGTYGNPLGSVNVDALNGSVERQPFSRFHLVGNLADQLVSVTDLELDTAGGQIRANGSFHHPRDTFTTGRAQLQVTADGIQLAQIQALAKQNAGVAGALHLSTRAALNIESKLGHTSVRPSEVVADFTARSLQVQNQNAGDLTAKVRTINDKLNYDLHSNFAGSTIQANGQTALTQDYTTTADASITDLSISDALKIAGQSAIPVSGNFSAKTHVEGTLQAPVAVLDFALVHGSAYQEPINSVKGSLRYSNKLAELLSLAIDVPAGNVNLSGSFAHPVDDYQTGVVKAEVNSGDIQLSKIRHIADLRPDLSGTFHIATECAGELQRRNGKPGILLSRLRADVSATGLHANETALGGMNLTARTSGTKLTFRLDSDFVQTQVHGAGEAQLKGEYPVRAELSFNNIRYSNLAPLLTTEAVAPPRYEALVEGRMSINGPVLDPDSLSARLELTRLGLHTNATTSGTGAPAARSVSLENKGPIVVALNRDVIQVEHFDIEGRNTMIAASGSVNLKDPAEPLALQLNANIDLGLLQDADRDFYSSGTVAMQAGIHGTFNQPRAIGQITLKDANINYANAPNGISNANGVIALNGTNATIQTLTGESGGGKISLTGFVGLGAGTPNFNLQAAATGVRVRYSGLSVTSNANISLSGNMRRSLVAGTVSIKRLAYASSTDAGSLLSVASTPPNTPSSPSRLLTGMRLAVHVVTAPDMQIVSSYANRLSVIANLTLRGTAENPGMLGRVSVTDGQLVFFGNTYTVTRGNVNFYDPTAIAPVLNVSLETMAQGVSVTIGVTGPMNDLKLTYRSDPPLTFEQIVQLLATNTTPANPVIAAHQPAPPQQSLSQMGESAVLGQAVANPLANRVQRVFGLTQFKIDPSFSGSNGQPSARVTLQQKITSNITFTYITDVSRTNAQIGRIQWDLTNNLSAVALRDYNGNVSLEIFYKFTRR